MKTAILSLILFISVNSFAQDTACKSWLADPYDSVDVIKQTAEKFLQTQLQLQPTESKTIYEMKDKEELNLVKVWMKQKKTVIGGSVATTYFINSIKITGLAEKIDILYKSLKDKVAKCTGETSATTTVFASGKMSVEKSGGDWSKQNLPLSTLTISSTR